MDHAATTAPDLIGPCMTIVADSCEFEAFSGLKLLCRRKSDTP